MFVSTPTFARNVEQFSSMKKGEKLTFWVAEGERFKIYGAPGEDDGDAK